jgi:hypothetical protein
MNIDLRPVLVWIEPDGENSVCDFCGDWIFLRQLSVMTYCSIGGKPVLTSFTIARLCGSCGEAFEDAVPF